MLDKNNEVFFGEYCKTCKYKNYSETDCPCSECIAEPVNLYSHKPIKWEGADGVFSGPPPRPDHAYQRAVKYVPEKRKDKEKAIARQNIDAEYTGNKVQNIDSEVTDDQYPSATAVKKALENKIDAPQVAQVGEVLTVEEIGENGKPKKWKTQKVEKDWNENDPTKPGYVKNRPFYVVQKEEILGNTEEDYYNACVAAEGTTIAEIIRCIVIDGVRYENVKPLYSSSTIAYSIGGHTLKVDRRYGGISLNPAADYYFIKITEEWQKLNYKFLPNSNLVNGNARGSMRSIVSTEESDDYQLGDYSIDFSAFGKVFSSYSVLFGMWNEIRGTCSMACGNGNSVEGMESFACGRNNLCTGSYSFCCGSNNTANGVSSVACGTFNESLGRSALAIGENNSVLHNYSVALGYRLITGNAFQTVVGKCNVEDSKALFIVGNGYTRSNGSVITKYGKNAMSVSVTGDGWFAGDVYVRSTSGTNKDDGSVRLATVEELSTCFRVNLNPTENDDGTVTYVSDSPASFMYAVMFGPISNPGNSIECYINLNENGIIVLNFIESHMTRLEDGNMTLSFKFSSYTSGKQISAEIKDTISGFNTDNEEILSTVVTVTENALVSCSMIQELTREQQELAKQNIGAGTLRKVYYWDVTNDTLEDPNSVMRCAEYGDTCICLNQTMLPHGMVGPVLVIYGEISYGRRSATAFDGSNATWTFSVNLSDYSYSTPIKKSGIPTPTSAQVGQIVKVKAVDADGKITETETVNVPTIPQPFGENKMIATEQTGENEFGYTLRPIPTINDFIDLGITAAQVGQIIKVKAVDDFGKPTAWEAVDMPTVPNDYELVFQETVAEDVGAYSRDVDKDGNPFSLTDVMVIIFTKPFAESTNSAGRALGFLPTSRWGHDTVSCDIGNSISSANTNSVGRYNVVFVKVVNGYQVVTRAYKSQNETNVFGVLMRQTAANNEMFGFHNDATKLMQIASPQGNITCVKIVGYTNPLVSAGTIVALYKKKGT